MNTFHAAYIIQGLFALWACIWIFGAVRNKTALHKDAVLRRLGYQAVILSGLILMFAGLPTLDMPDSDWFVRSIAFNWVCVSIVAVGLGFAVYARFYLGRNWSGTIQLKKDHTLIRSGPYQIVRHPIYSGLLLAFIGLGIFLDRWLELPALFLLIAGFTMKARREEIIMLSRFGEDYRDLQHATGMFLPRLLYRPRRAGRAG